jgi:hypothetical protein
VIAAGIDLVAYGQPGSLKEEGSSMRREASCVKPAFGDSRFVWICRRQVNHKLETRREDHAGEA